MVEFAVVLTTPRLAIEIDQNSFFYPFEEKKTSIVPIPPLPKYVLGIVELEGDLCICIDMKRFLTSREEKAIEINYGIETVLVKVSGDKGRNHFALKIPLPEVRDLDTKEITWERLLLKNNPLPYRPANIEEMGPSLVFNKEILIPFLLSEIGGYLSEIESKTYPSWIKAEEGLAKNSPHKNIPLNLPNLIGSHEGKKAKKIAVLRVGSGFFGLEEDLVLGIEPIPNTITPVPQAPSWIIGLWKSQFDPTVVIDMAHLLDLEYSNQVKNQMIVVVKDGSSAFALLCDEVLGTFAQTELKSQIAKDEKIDVWTPISDIYKKEDLEVPILGLNMKFLKNCARWSVENFRKSDRDWLTLLSKIQNERIEDKNRENFEEIFETNAFIVPYKKLDVVFPQDYVTELFPAFQVERIKHKNAVFAGYRNLWIPSFHLTDFVDGKKDLEDETYGFSIFVTDGTRFLELITSNVDLGRMGESLENMNETKALLKYFEGKLITDIKILGGRHQLEINPQNLIEEGFFKLAKMLDVNEISMEQIQAIIDRPAPDMTTDHLFEGGLFEIWKKDGLPFLVVSAGETEIAVQLRKIDKIVRRPEDVEGEKEIVPWKEGKLEIPMYVVMKKADKTIVYEMPLSAKLVILSSEEVIKDETNTYIVLDGSNVPILDT